MTAPVRFFTVTATKPGERAGILSPLDIIDVGSVGIAEGTADVSEVRPTSVDQSGVWTHSGKEKVDPFPGTSVSDTPTAAKLVIFCTVTDL